MIAFVYVLNCLNYYAAWLAFNWNNVPPHLERGSSLAVPNHKVKELGANACLVVCKR